MTTAAIEKTPISAAIGPALEVYERMNTIRSVLAPDLNDQELQLFAIVADRMKLDPFAKQVYAIKRKGRVTFQVGVDGFRSSAEGTGEYRGSDEPEFGPIVETGAARFPHPEWARVVVHRQFKDGSKLDQPATVHFDEYYPGEDQGFQWKKMPRVMLAKCAEAAAFRKAFPKRFSDVYTPEEMAQADVLESARPVGPTARERIAERRAQLEATAGDVEVGSGSANENGKTVPEAAEDVVDGLFTEAGQQVDGDTGEIRDDSLVTRLQRVYYAHLDEANKSYTGEQKTAIRELFTGVDPLVIGRLLKAAFNNEPVNGRFSISQAEAIAILDCSKHDRDLFLVEASTLGKAA